MWKFISLFVSRFEGFPFLLRLHSLLAIDRLAGRNVSASQAASQRRWCDDLVASYRRRYRGADPPYYDGTWTPPASHWTEDKSSLSTLHCFALLLLSLAIYLFAQVCVVMQSCIWYRKSGEWHNDDTARASVQTRHTDLLCMLGFSPTQSRMRRIETIFARWWIVPRAKS